jgi:hypothetical protein
MRLVVICLHQSHHRGRCQLIAVIKPSRPAQWRILWQIHLGVKDRGLFYIQAYPFCESNIPEKKKKKQRKLTPVYWARSLRTAALPFVPEASSGTIRWRSAFSGAEFRLPDMACIIKQFYLCKWTMFWQDYISIFLRTKDHYYWYRGEKKKAFFALA